MKQCPVCRTTYTDATLVYCLSDGNALVDVGGQGAGLTEEETIAIGRGGQMRVEIPQAESSRLHTPPAARADAPVRSSNVLLKVLLALLAIGFLAAAAVVIGMLVYFNRPPAPQLTSIPNANSPRSSPLPTTSPATDETEELRQQIANLERLINEQKKDNRGSEIQLPMPKQSSTTRSARVSSPGDGFLALRTLPDSEVGARILKIPHGATVSVGGCGPVVRPVSRTGRWCQASYNGYSGWVFDAYLIY